MKQCFLLKAMKFLRCANSEHPDTHENESYGVNSSQIFDSFSQNGLVNFSNEYETKDPTLFYTNQCYNINQNVSHATKFYDYNQSSSYSDSFNNTDQNAINLTPSSSNNCYFYGTKVTNENNFKQQEGFTEIPHSLNQYGSNMAKNNAHNLYTSNTARSYNQSIAGNFTHSFDYNQYQYDINISQANTRSLAQLSKSNQYASNETQSYDYNQFTTVLSQSSRTNHSFNNTAQSYDYNQSTASNLTQTFSCSQYTPNEPQFYNINPCSSDPAQTHVNIQSKSDSYFSNNGEGNGTHYDYNIKNFNNSFNSQDKIDQSTLSEDHSNAFEPENGSCKLIVTQAHLDFLKNIIENINSEYDRLSNSDLKKDFFFYFSSECIKLLEEFKKFNLQNHKNLKASNSKSKADKLAKNSEFLKETDLFLNLLSSLKPDNSSEESKREYCQALISYINTRIHEKNCDFKVKNGTSLKTQKITLKRDSERINESKNTEKDSLNIKKTKSDPAFCFRRALFSKKYFYFLYNNITRNIIKLQRYEYRDNSGSKYFSTDKLDAKSLKTMAIGSHFKSIFLDSNGTFYILMVHKKYSVESTYSYIKKIREELIFEVSYKVNEFQDLVIDGVAVDEFIVYQDKIYILDCRNKRVLIYSTNFEKKNEIKFRPYHKIINNSHQTIFAVRDYIVIIIEVMSFIWKIDSGNDSFEVLGNALKDTLKFYNASLYAENKHICKCKQSYDICIFKIENAGNLPFLRQEFLKVIPYEIGQKNCEIFKFFDGEIYCAYLRDGKYLDILKINEDAAINKIFKD